jgi:hypothetical protein
MTARSPIPAIEFDSPTHPLPRRRYMFARTLVLTILLAGALPAVAKATPERDLDDAAKHKEVAFVLVVEPGASGTQALRSLAQEAAKKVKKAVFVEFDRADPENAALVNRLGVLSAPVPLILVVAQNGTVSGGFGAATATVEGLVAAVPSPKQSEVLKALQEGKAVFLVVSPPNANGPSADACMRACSEIAPGGVVIKIDLNDDAEAAFLTQLKVDRSARESAILVVNPQGQITGTFTGPVEAPLLVDAAKKKLGGCCPPSATGPSKTCPPSDPK